MIYSNLGKSELTISRVGIGCMSLSKDNMSLNQKILYQAMDSGINYFDTADLYEYGENEIMLGKLLKDFRHNIIIATKVGNQWNKDHSGWAWNVSSEYINKAIDDSLKRLDTDYIDLYQIHGGTKEDDYEEVVFTLEALKKKGKIRAYGISSIRPNVFMKYATYSNISSNMMQYSLLDSRPEAYVDHLITKNVSILARGVFGQGLLLGKDSKPYLGHEQNDVQKIIDLAKQNADLLNMSVEAFCISYLLQNQQASAAVIGVRTIEQMKVLSKAITQISNFPKTFSNLHLPKLNYREHLV